MTTSATSSPSASVESGISPISTSPTTDLPNIAFVGKMGAGKTTAAEYVRAEYGYTILRFAGLLKQVAQMIWGVGADRDREKLQRLGVAVRDIEENSWADAVFRDLDKMIGPVVIDDCRFPNEYWGLKERGFHFVQITAPEALREDRLQRNGKLTDRAQLQHVSETALDDILEPDKTIINANTTAWDFEDRIRVHLEWARRHR